MARSGLYYYNEPNNILNSFNTLPSSHYESILSNQRGGGSIPYFQGIPSQSGSGILTDVLVPMIERAVPVVSNVIRDVKRGRKLGSSVKRRVIQAGRAMLKGGGGRRKRMKKANKKKVRPRKKISKKKKHPLFD